MVKKQSPLDELQAQQRRISPKVLRGAAKETWDQFVVNYKRGQYDGLTMISLYEWAEKHCKLTCSFSCFRNQLLKQAK